MKFKYLILLLILILGGILRFYRLGEIPSGFHQDEVSQAYNAFSILKTGRDRYGEYLPILFRSFGSYQPPVYTYLTPIPIFLFGNTIFAARSTSAFFGVLTILLTYLIVGILTKPEYKEKLSLFSAFVIAISPWAIHFSRRVVEGNLGLAFFLLALLLFLHSLKKINLFPVAAFFLGIATHAYYSERLISVIFLPAFVVYFKQYLLKQKKWLILGLIVFFVTLIPHVVTVATGAFASRFDQVSYFGDRSLIGEFLKHYVSYFSPKNLFSDIGSNLGRISPGLGVFYSWFFVPFLVGLYFLFKVIRRNFIWLLGIIATISLIPVAMTGDVFYPLRALEFFWLLSVLISIGLMTLFNMIKGRVLKTFVTFALLFYFLCSFYISYFVLFNHENTENVGQTYMFLSRELEKYKDYPVVLDSTRDPAAGLRIAYFKEFSPIKLQEELRSQLKNSYYNRHVDLNELYVIDNITVRPIDWKIDECAEKTILIGDNLAFSEQQIKEHHLKELFKIESVNKDFTLKGYNTNPDNQCL